MKHLGPYIAAASVAVAVYWSLGRWADPVAVLTVYDSKIQAALFTGFLTVGSFLLATKTSILVRLRDGVYLNPSYKRRYLAQNRNEYKGDYYKGLVQLKDLLVVSVIAAYVTSLAQVTIGFTAVYAVKLFCISMAAGTLVLVLIGWYVISLNLRDWFIFIESEAERSIKNPPQCPPS